MGRLAKASPLRRRGCRLRRGARRASGASEGPEMERKYIHSRRHILSTGAAGWCGSIRRREVGDKVVSNNISEATSDEGLKEEAKSPRRARSCQIPAPPFRTLTIAGESLTSPPLLALVITSLGSARKEGSRASARSYDSICLRRATTFAS